MASSDQPPDFDAAMAAARARRAMLDRAAADLTSLRDRARGRGIEARRQRVIDDLLDDLGR